MKFYNKGPGDRAAKSGKSVNLRKESLLAQKCQHALKKQSSPVYNLREEEREIMRP